MASEVKEIIQSIQSSKKSEFLSGCSRLLGSVIGLDMEKTGKDGIYSLILQGDENKDQTLIGEGLAQAIKAYSGSIEGVYPIAILDRMLLSYEADRYAHLHQIPFPEWPLPAQPVYHYPQSLSSRPEAHQPLHWNIR